MGAGAGVEKLRTHGSSSCECSPAMDREFGICTLNKIDETRELGLTAKHGAELGTKLYSTRPLVYIQSSCSRRAALTCPACLVPIDSLATQLGHLGLAMPGGIGDVCVRGACAVPCLGGCSQQFCSQECCTWAASYSPHALLCESKLSPSAVGAWKELWALAESECSEELSLLDNMVAMMLLEVRWGRSEEEVLQHYLGQFVSRPWQGKLADVPHKGEVLQQASRLLNLIFEGEKLVESFASPELISRCLGCLELVSMHVYVPHPLNQLSSQNLHRILPSTTLAALFAAQQPKSNMDNEITDASELADSSLSELEERCAELESELDVFFVFDLPNLRSDPSVAIAALLSRFGELATKAKDSLERMGLAEEAVCSGLVARCTDIDVRARLRKLRAQRPVACLEHTWRKSLEERCEELELAVEAIDAAKQGRLFAEVSGYALCEAVAFMNHSCEPNSQVSFVNAYTPGAPPPTLGGLWVRCVATVDIKAGEEVVMSYTPEVYGQPLEMRRRLLHPFGFECACRKCLLEGEAKNAGYVQ